MFPSCSLIFSVAIGGMTPSASRIKSPSGAKSTSAIERKTVGDFAADREYNVASAARALIAHVSNAVMEIYQGYRQ